MGFNSAFKGLNTPAVQSDCSNVTALVHISCHVQRLLLQCSTCDSQCALCVLYYTASVHCACYIIQPVCTVHVTLYSQCALCMLHYTASVHCACYIIQSVCTVHITLHGTAEKQSNGFRTENMYKSHSFKQKENQFLYFSGMAAQY